MTCSRACPKLRNRVIGRVFHELGLIEQWGSGIQRMVAVCRDAGLASPVLEEIGARFRVTIHTTGIGAPSVDKTDQAHSGCSGSRQRTFDPGHCRHGWSDRSRHSQPLAQAG